MPGFILSLLLEDPSFFGATSNSRHFRRMEKERKLFRKFPAKKRGHLVEDGLRGHARLLGGPTDFAQRSLLYIEYIY